MKIAHERRIQLSAFAAAIPAVATSLWVLWTGDYTPKVQWTLSAIIVGTLIGFANKVREEVASPLRTVANLLEAIREGDYSIRGRTNVEDDSLGEVLEQVNAMGATMQLQRLGALEATALLRKVMEEINVAIFAFDGEGKVRLVNKGGEALLGRPSERLLGETAVSLELEDCLREDMRTITRSFPGGSGRWGVSRSTFREGGVPHQLLVLTDLTRPLREEELQAWQRIVRVLGHELNNSLAPIKSIAGSLGNIIDRDPLPDDWREDMKHGLNIIGSRAESLQRFLSAYTRLAKLPSPTMRPVNIRPLVERTVALELRKKVEIVPGPEIIIEADADQIEQVLINLIKNAVEATQSTGGAVRVTWTLLEQRVLLGIEDEGPGLANTANLFVPFFTTKPGGSGIGLVLCRQIAEAHGGTLELKNNVDRAGCTARLYLPLGNPDAVGA
jgi:two-component system, NtrC family, nitrogen regulation sensor histidine kinase NtrY